MCHGLKSGDGENQILTFVGIRALYVMVEEHQELFHVDIWSPCIKKRQK